MAKLTVYNKDGLQSAINHYTNAVLLAANVPEFFTVPTDDQGLKANYVVFGLGQATTDNFYVQAFTSTDGADRAVNGGFDADTDWTKGSGWTIAAGVATAAGATSADLSQVPTSPLIEGMTYLCTYTTTRSAGSVALSLGGGTAGATVSSGTTTVEVLTAGSTQTILFDATGFTGTIDNVSILPCAKVPGDTTLGNASRQNPPGLFLNGQVSKISVVSAGTPIVTASFYK